MGVLLRHSQVFASIVFRSPSIRIILRHAQNLSQQQFFPNLTKSFSEKLENWPRSISFSSQRKVFLKNYDVVLGTMAPIYWIYFQANSRFVLHALFHHQWYLHLSSKTNERSFTRLSTQQFTTLVSGMDMLYFHLSSVELVSLAYTEKNFLRRTNELTSYKFFGGSKII